MATPNTSHYKPAPTPRPPTSASVMTPASFSASSPAAPPSTHSTGPGHRSHQSPAHFSSSSSSTTRAGKSPFNHLQQSHLVASAAGGQPMSRSGTNTSSPPTIPNMGAFVGLNGMLMNAIEGGNFKTGLTPAGGIGTPGVSPLPSHLGAGEGVGTSVNGSLVRQQVRDQEEERKIRLEAIVQLMGQRWGYVSREGVERCARRVGLECLWDDELPGTDSRTLSIAGNSVLVDVTFVGTGDEVGSVTLAFPGREDGAWGTSAKEGAQVLQKDLKGENKETLAYVALEPFVANLERLGNLDRLAAGDVNCFDAVDGIGGALRKIWEMEMTKRKEGKDVELQEGVEIDVMCKDSGKPTMHAEGRLGLALQYWMDRRHLAGWNPKADEMEVDGAERTVSEKPSTWSATIECQSSSVDMYTSIRVSSNWIGEPVGKPAADQEDPFSSSINEASNINWQDPPPTFANIEPPQPASTAMDLGVDTILPQKPPDVRFTARLHPPVLVPLQTAINIFNSVGVQEAIQPTTYDSLLLPDEDGTPSLSTTERVVEREVSGPSDDAGSMESGARHKYTLFTDAQAYARNIEEIPFAHPRQIVALLPVLRQWVFVSSLLRRCFQPSSEQGDEQKDVSNANPVSTSDSDSDSDSSDSDSSFDHDGRRLPIRSFTSEMKAFPHLPPSSSPSRLPRPTPIDISLSLSGSAPRFDLIFPHKDDLASIAFSVEANAEIADVEILLGGAGAGADGNEKMDGDGVLEPRMKKRKEAVKRVLELSEDLGVLVRWVRRGGMMGRSTERYLY
ncbi:hypothetical protein XANCAGTX0491_006713 [Xanthoria calcicola]